MQLLPSVDVEVLLLFLLDHIVVSCWTCEMVPVWTAWVVVAAGWEVADTVDVGGREARDGDGGVEVEEDVVVPCGLVRMEEERDVWEVVVVVDYVGEVGHGFVPFVSGNVLGQRV